MIEKPEIAAEVAAVFVTMNRCGTAKTCLERLANQTLRPGRVFIINNASTDDTAALLDEEEISSNGWIIHQDLNCNVGNAGGMELALERVFADGYDAVWVLDDDSWPEPDALARLMAAELPWPAVRSCRVLDLATGALSWPLQVQQDGGWQLLERHDALPAGGAIRIRRAWLGALIPLEVYQAVGPVEGRLFLRGEDEDYPRRIENAGFPVFMVTNSLLHHPPSGPLKHWKMGSYTVVLESSLEGNSLYYRLRNSWWMIRRDRGTLVAAAVALMFALALLRWKRRPFSWMGIWCEAFRDALTGRLGKRRAKL